MEKKSLKERQYDLRQRREEMGLKRVEIWVHEDDRDELIEFANQQRSKRFGSDS
jgi:hypothetical protein